jgi:protein-S-isoprenylcysteine O-methyltransferase Ste14
MGIFLFSILAYILGPGSMAAFFWYIQFLIDQFSELWTWKSIFENFALFLLFPLQHSLLARPAFKNRIAAKTHPLVERPIYVATSGIAMWIVLLRWKRFGPLLYRFQNGHIFDAIFYLSILAIIAATIALNHNMMFGLKQGYAAFKGKHLDQDGALVTSGIYGIVRHPLTTLLIISLWSHASMTLSRALFNILFTAYALAGTVFEERDLIRKYGDEYRAYRKKVAGYIPGII